jgi:hypothetical protein
MTAVQREFRREVETSESPHPSGRGRSSLIVFGGSISAAENIKRRDDSISSLKLQNMHM